jgi:hypothetical protein
MLRRGEAFLRNNAATLIFIFTPRPIAAPSIA